MSPVLVRTCLAVFACLLWSTAFAAVKLGLADFHKPLTLAGIRFMISGLMLFPFWGSYRENFKSVFKDRKTLLLTGFFNTFLLYALFFEGMTLVTGAIGAIVTGASPLVVSIVSHCMQKNDRMTPAKTLPILIGIAGIVIISLRKDTGDGSMLSQFAGIMLLLAASVSSAVGNVIVHKSSSKALLGPLQLNSCQLFLGGLGLFVVALIVEGVPDLTGRSYRFYFALVWLATLSAVAFSIWFMLLRRPGTKVSDLNQWKFLVPLSGACLSWFIVPGESPSLPTISGMVLIVVALILYFRAARAGNVVNQSE